MADKGTRLILEALGRAACEPTGMALLASKTESGLFPATSFARAAAERCKEQGWLEVIREETQGRSSREICILTEKGMQYLARHSSPRQILEDFLRLLESRQSEVIQLTDAIRHMQHSLQSMQTTIEQLIPQMEEASHRNGFPFHHSSTNNGVATMTTPKVRMDTIIAEIKAKLAEWHAAQGTAAMQDCPLPELYRKLELDRPISIGQFHDALRQLHDDHQIYLHPWTGPLYALPEPCFALLVGHEIGFYVSIR